MSAVTKKRKFVSLKVKLEALKRLDNGETLKKLALEYGVGEVTVGDWRRNRLKLEQFSSTKCSEESLNRKNVKKSEFEKTGESLFMWFTQQRQKGAPISGPILQEKALFFRDLLKEGDESFSASVGWLDKWKKRHGVRQLDVCGEKLSGDSGAVSDFIEKFKQIITKENLSAEQIYNCDETGLNFKLLPAKTLASREEKSAPGHKKSKERLTIMAASNATGNHKLKLVMIGKPAKPRCFKNVNMSALPLIYTNQNNAWMNREIFKNWFLNTFVPECKGYLIEKGLPSKAILTMDNASSHPSAEELECDGIRALFLPPNVTSLIQPMDQGVLECLKKKYRRRLLQSILHSDDNESVIDALKKVNVKDVTYWISESWNEIKPETISKSWRKILQETPEVRPDAPTDVYEDEDDVPLSNLIRRLPGCEMAQHDAISEWMNEDEQLEVTDETIVDMVNNTQQCEDENETEAVPLMTHTEGYTALEAAMRYVEQQPEATPTDVLLLRRWRDIAARKRCSFSKQKTIHSFFNK